MADAAPPLRFSPSAIINSLPIIGGLLRIYRALRAFYRSLPGNTPRQMRTLAAGWFICGVFFTLGSFASIPNALVFIFFVLTPLKEGSGWHPSQGEVAAIAAFVVFMLIVHVALARVCFYACQSISTRKNYGYVIWAGKMAKLIFPVGTALGWGTLRVLAKSEVRREFDPEPDAAPNLSPPPGRGEG